MRILVTAGNTQTPLDRVRCITNIFSGRTGGQIAAHAYERGHSVTILTSHPEVLDSIPTRRARNAPDWRMHPYRTFDDLATAMAEEIPGGRHDVVIHAAAVSDYEPAGVFSLAPGTSFVATEMVWDGASERPRMLDASRGKVKSTHPELWLRLVPTPKLVDRVRRDWDFQGTLVKFKLEVGLSEAELLEVAERGRTHSIADVMVANTLEGMTEWAVIGTGPGAYEKVSRAELPGRLITTVEELASGNRDAHS
jgi:phosphopantothenate-cysteine ligase/phosphopantothenoylcysteine decarboxylase/phosphopantothenate--cysteine ligase